MRLIMLVLCLGLMCLGLAACVGTSYSVGEIQGNDFHVLHHDFGPFPAIEVGQANSCIETRTQVGDRANYCRVIDGYDGVGDRRNWRILFRGISGEPAGWPLAQSGNSADPYGVTIVLDDGAIFEGCNVITQTHSYSCSYRARKAVVERVSTGSWGYILHKAWDWTRYVGSAAGCAGGIAGVMVGKPITLPLLTGCVDGPQ